MYEKYRTLIQWRSNLAMAGRFEDLAREFTLPLVMYLGDRMMVIHGQDQLIALLMQLQNARRTRLVAQVVSELTAMELSRHGRFRIWVRHHDLDAAGQAIASSDAVYYCRETQSGLRTEMAEYSAYTIPEIWAEADRRQPRRLASDLSTT